MQNCSLNTILNFKENATINKVLIYGKRERERKEKKKIIVIKAKLKNTGYGVDTGMTFT